MALFILDSNIFIRMQRMHPKDIFVQMWTQLELSVAAGDVMTAEEVFNELDRGDDDLSEWVENQPGLVVPFDDDCERALKAVNARCPTLVDIDSERSLGDPFVIATAMITAGTVVTTEKPRKDPVNDPMKIPDACQEMSVTCIGWFEFLRAIAWNL